MSVGDVYLKRKRSGFTQYVVGKEAGLNAGTLVSIELGRIEPTQEILKSISEAIDRLAAQRKAQQTVKVAAA